MLPHNLYCERLRTTSAKLEYHVISRGRSYPDYVSLGNNISYDGIICSVLAKISEPCLSGVPITWGWDNPVDEDLGTAFLSKDIRSAFVLCQLLTKFSAVFTFRPHGVTLCTFVPFYKPAFCTTSFPTVNWIFFPVSSHEHFTSTLMCLLVHWASSRSKYISCDSKNRCDMSSWFGWVVRLMFPFFHSCGYAALSC